MTDGVPDRAGRKPPWRERKERYLAQLSETLEEVVLVSAADKVHNATAISNDYCEIGDAVFERFKPSKVETVWYYQSLAAVLGDRLGHVHRLMRRLRAAMSGWAEEA